MSYKVRVLQYFDAAKQLKILEATYRTKYRKNEYNCP